MSGGGGRVQDNSHKVAQIQADEARAAREAEERREQQRRGDFNTSLEGSYSSAINDAMSFFQQQGLDPSQYASQISDAALSRRTSVPQMDSNPAAFFANLGQSVFGNLESGERNQAMRSLQQLFPQNFENQRIGRDAADPFIDSILGEKQNEATQYAENLAARGVINNSALSRAMREIQDQSSRGRTNLQQISDSVLERGRGDLRDIFNTGQQSAQNLQLGQQFDPSQFLGEKNTSLERFFASLGDNLRSAAPSDMFDTSRILNLAGQAQGAQNTRFDPQALLGIMGDDDGQQQRPNTQQQSVSPFGAF